MKMTDRPIANPSVVLREEFDDWAVLFNPDTADAVGTNPVGVAIWKKMDGTQTIDHLVSEITDSFVDIPDTAPAEITAFVNRLAQTGFVGLELK